MTVVLERFLVVVEARGAVRPCGLGVRGKTLVLPTRLWVVAVVVMMVTEGQLSSPGVVIHGIGLVVMVAARL